MATDKKKKNQIQLRPERATVRSSGGEAIKASPSIAAPRQSYREHVTGGAYKVPSTRTLENLAAEHIAKQEEEKRRAQTSPATSFSGMQDWRPSYMRQQAQPALTQPQPVIPQPQTTVPTQNRQTPTSGNVNGPSPVAITRQEGTARQNDGRASGPKMPSIGRFGAGNIDLFNRPQYRQPDGSLSTVNSISIGTDDGEVLIPTIGRDAQGRPVQWTDDEAIEQYNKTGQYLGKFNTVEEADRYADQLHRQQEIYYGSDIGKNDPVSMQRLMGIQGGIDRSDGVNQTIGNARDDVEILQGEPKNLTREGQWAARHPYAGTVMYGVTNVVGSGEGVFNTAEAALRALANNEKLDLNAVKSAPLAQAYRTGSAEGFRRGLQEGITAPVAKAIGIDSDDGRYSRGEQAMDFLSGVVADRVSSLMNMGIAGGLSGRMNALTPAQSATIGRVSGALMGANAANQSLYETSSDEDTAARESLALGITSGIWEALFEAYSTESLLSNATPTSIKDLLVKTAAQFGVEFQEEAATEGANIISDYIIRGDDSEIGKDVAAFKANNPDADPNEVARHALLSALYQVSMAGLGGGLSGAMGGGVMALNQFRGGTQLRSGVRSGDVSLNDIANTADTSTPQGQRVYELANELARREAEGQRNSAMRYGALNNAIINDIEANGETRLEQAAASAANARESAIDRTNRIREALRGDNAQAAWETPEDTGVRDVVLPSEMREQAAYDLLETRNADRISWDTEQGFVSLDRESDGSYTFTNERGETVTMDSQQAAELIPAEQMLTIYDYEGNTEAQNQIAETQNESPSTATDVPSTEPTTPSTAPSTADTGINASADNVNADVERQNMVEARVAPDATADQNLTQLEGETAQQMEAQNPVAISQQNTSGDQSAAQTANERLEEAARQVTQRRTVEKAAQLREVYEARKNNSPNLRSVVNSATMLSQAELERALNMGARDALVNTAQEEISNGREEGESLSGQRGNGILSQRTGKRTGRVSAETEAVRRIWRSGEAPADSGAEVLRFAERRRASEVIPESSEDSFVYIPANKTESMEQGEAEANSFGLNVVSWAGGEAVSDKGNTFRGATVPGSDELYAQADNADFSQDKIIKHEIAENKLSKAEFEQIIEEAKGKSDFVKAAIEIYQSLSGEDEYRSAKELVCDSNGRMNQFERRAQENPDNAGYQVIREILQRAIDTINPIVSEKLETKKVRRTAGATNNVSSKNTAQGKANSVNNKTEHSVELPYTFGSKAAKAWVEKLDPEAKKYADLFIALHEIGLKNQAEVWITSKGQKKLARRDIAAKNMLVSEWNSYIDSNKEFADAAKKLAEAVPEDIRKNADISPDGRIKPTEFDERLKLMRSFMQRIVDSLPGGLAGNKTLVNGKEVTISRHSKIPSIGGEAYRKALLEERRRQYREGTLGKVAIGGLSGDDWGTMGFLATNTKTIGSGDFTTFCPQMYFGNGGCWYCYRLSALRSGTNNKLVGQNVWYTGEILRLRQQDIDNLNSTGGLRIQSFGDWMEKYTPQLLDLLVDAETVGLQIKIITKEPSMIDAVALLKEQGYGKNLYFNLSADYTIEEQKGPYQPNAARPSMVGGDGVGKEGKTYWKRALSVEEANEYRKKYPWVNIRTVATNIDEFINSLESPYVQVVTGYHGRDFAMKKDENGNMTGGYERISSETGDTLVEVESLGDNGMPVFDYSPEQNKWVRIRDGKNKKQKALADAIEDRGLQFAYYIKACCQTGRCKDCKGNCGAVARDFAVKNATNKDQESIKYWDKIRKTIAEAKGETYKDDFPLLLKMAKAAGAEMKDQDSAAPEKFWQKRMRAITSDEFGETAKYQFPQLLKQSKFDAKQEEQEQRQAIFQAGLDGDEDYEDVIAKAYLVPIDERYRILQDGMRAAAGDKGHVEHSVRLPEGLSNYQRRNLEFNKNETTVGNPLKTVAGTTIKRYGWTKKSPDGVGKQLSYSKKKSDEKGSQIYLHKNYAYDVVPQNVYDKALELLKQERPDFKFNTIMYLGTNKRQIVRFDEAPDFDTAREPIPGDMIAVNVTDGTVDTGHSDQIWHHKWLWVKNDYKGFDVKKSWEWSKLWLSVIRDTKNKGELIDGTKVRIDNKGIANGMGENGKWWNEQLRYFGLPIDGEDVDYDSRTRADKFVSNLKATQEQRANEPQTDTSEDTSLNQVPASMTNFRFNSDDVVLDWGGGRYDAARRFMESEYPGLKMYVYDPFNRTKAYNNAVLDQMKKQSASVVTINNVLNVINSEKAQRDVVSESKKYLKENGVAIFTIYQGDKSGIGEVTKEKDDNGEEIGTSSWQNNLETAEYVPMIQDYYKHVKATGNFIIASDSESALKNVRKTNKDEKSGLVSRSKPFIEQKYDMKTAEGFDADSGVDSTDDSVQYSAKFKEGIDVEAAADDPNNTNVIRQGSDQDIRYSSKLFDKDVDDRLKASMATLFSGGGTVDFAVRSIVQHEFAVEFKEKIAAVYRANVGGTMYVDDVRTVNINPHKGRVEYLHISPVCTDYSSANNKQGERDIDLKTAEAAARIIDELQPKVVTVENVRRYKNSRAVQIIEEALERNHYLHDKKVYRASDFGGATIRERMFIRAVKDGVLPEVDTSKYTPMTWYDAVKDMIPKLPTAELSNYMRGRLGVSGIDLDNLKQPVFVLGGEKSGELTFATADKPAPTILAKSTEAKILMPDGRILRATPRVMARIQGLPDEFDLGLKNDYDMEESRGNVTNAYRVVGNGVPVQLTQGIVGPLLEENLIKQKSKETGIQYSSKLDSAGSRLTEQQVEYFKNSKVRDENGNLKRMYHGTRRADRVGTVFRPEMATSGPMAYFTDDESIAQNYSRDKEDTSLKKEGAGDYHRMFRMNIGGKAYTVEDAWDRLPASKRAEIRRKAPHITMDDDYENIIYDKNANKGLGNYDNYLIRDNGGNYIKALVESWLDDGTLYGDEGKFKEVLSLAGLEDVEYLDPEFRDEKVYAVYLNVTNPLVTNDIPQKVINNLRKASETVDWNGPDSNVDSWDKTNVSPQEWFKDFERDIENGTAYVWTRIPDWVTNVLKDMGYDGISDMGGKKGGVTHNVVIPFSSEQIKNIDNQNPTKNVDIRYSSKLRGDIDKKYDAALRGNDMKTAERLVKEAAEEAGYKLAAYHGTGENFTVFNPGFEGIHLGNREQAEDVAKTRFDQRSKNSNYKWKDIRNRVKEMNREQRESLVSAAYRLGDYYDAPADDFAFDGNIMNDKEVTDYVDREVEGYSKATGENNPRFTMRTFDRETGENVMELYAKINNPLVINGDIVDWEMEHIARLLKAIDRGDDKFLPLFRRDYIDISNAKLKLTSEDKKLLNQAVRTATSDTAVESWNALKEVLANHGYDGIQYKNEYEGDRQSWSYIALNPSDVKSAEAVTYDDNGNVIPLSERFNPENEDIRYSSALKSPENGNDKYSLNVERSGMNVNYQISDDGKRIAISPESYLNDANWKKVHNALNRLGYGMPSVDITKKYVLGGYNLQPDQSEAVKKILGIAFESKEAVVDVGAAKKTASKAARTFGTTNDFKKASYLTVNGTMLDFSEGQGYRTLDHRAISRILDLPDDAGYSDGMIEFMNQGNIRLQTYGAEIVQNPNKEQRKVLRRQIESLDGEFTLDVSNEAGYNVFSVDYPEGTRPARVFADIDRYFEDGTIPERNETDMFYPRYSSKLNDPDYAPTFYSKLQREIQNYKGEKIGAASVESYLKGKGVKDEEIKWSGIRQFLEGKKSVNKQELMQYLRDNEMEIEETVLDNGEVPASLEMRKRQDEIERESSLLRGEIYEAFKKRLPESTLTKEDFEHKSSGDISRIIAQEAKKDKKFEQLKAKYKDTRLKIGELIRRNDYFGFESQGEALSAIEHDGESFCGAYEMSDEDAKAIKEYLEIRKTYKDLDVSDGYDYSPEFKEYLEKLAKYEVEKWNIRREISKNNEKHKTKWSEYRTHGGENYREILFSFPGSEYSNDSMKVHWGREGVLAHARVQDFWTDDGDKVLFVEEIQSDWHNAGQKEGYKSNKVSGEIAKLNEQIEAKHKEIKETKRKVTYRELQETVAKYTSYKDEFGEYVQSNLANVGQPGFQISPEVLGEVKRRSDKLLELEKDMNTKREQYLEYEDTIKSLNEEAHKMQRQLRELKKEDEKAPEAPFRTTYTDYVLKNLLRIAAEGDYDYLAWTTSGMQMERWNPDRESTAALTGGNGADDDVAFEEGYRIEYDQQIPKFLKKYGKQWGAGLSTISIGTGANVDMLKQHVEQEKRVFKLVDDATGKVIASVIQDDNFGPRNEAEAMDRFRTMTIGTPVPAITVNDAMKDSVLTEGQPMYSRSLTAGMSTQDLDNRINDLVKKYGALPKGEKPARNVDVPMQTSDNKNTRRFVRTILESGITSADLDDSIKSAIINESLSYEVATDKEAAEYAASVIRIGGVERAQREWDKARRSDTFNKDHMALGQFLLKEYAKNNDIDNAMNMIQDLAAEGTRMGQNIQAMRMLKKYAQQVPAIGLGYIQRTVDQMNREAKAKMGKRYKEMRIAPNLAAEYIKAQTRDEIDAALGKIYKNLGSQVQKTVPEEIHDKLRTWRYMSMLGNPRTHIRNLVGNALFVPAVTLKNAIGTGLEGAMNTSVKTKSLTVTKQAMEFAKQDALDMQDVLSGESEKSIRDLIMDQRKVYKFEPLNKASKGNSAALEAEDWVFLRWHYQNALAQYITANHLDTTVQNPAWLGRARRYAVQEAQKATYRDANKVSTWLNQSKGAGAVVKYMMEGLMPFKKTPTNILRRGIEYSPAGLVRTMSKSIYDLNTGKMTVNEWIDALSSGLAGTAIFGIGMFLASTGAILGGYKDDDDKELRKLKGLQEYSVIIGNHTYTIDWAAPGSLPLFIGVETMNALKQERGMTMDDMGKAAARLIDPMINMSMLSGLNDTLDAISYSDDKLSAATMEMFYSLLGQYVPTLFGQVARTIDTTQRINYQDVNTGKPKNMLYFIEKMQNKIPFLTFSNDPYLNEFGQENSGTPHWAAALQNFVSPGYVSEIKDDHVLDEVARLNEAQDKEKVLPRKMQKFIGSGKDRIDLTSSEYHTFQKVAGQTAYNILDAMIDDNRYNSMNANQQATAIKVAYDYAKAVGRIEIQPKYKEDLDGKVKKVYEDVQNGMQAYDSILNRIRTDNVSEGIKPDLDENGNAIDNSAKYKTIDKILGTSMSKAEKARTFETAYPSKSLDAWKASGGDVYDYMMGTKLQQDVSKLSEEQKKKTYEYVINNKNYTNYQKVAWFVSDKNRTESKNYLAWKDAKGSDWDYIKSRSDLEKFTGLDTKTKRSKVIGYIKRQTTNEAKRKALWQMAGYDLDSTKNKKTVKNGNYNKYFK